ncbi:MAG: type II secretion system minor pseudopilin GspH [Parashewanella sp.]
MKANRQFGFTLLEVMLVVLLMGLAATAVTLSLSSVGPEKKLEKQAKKFIASLELVLDETVLSGQFWGVVIKPDHYQFVTYKDEKWQQFENDRLLAGHDMQDGISLEVTIDGLPLKQSDEENESWFKDDDSDDDTEFGKKKQPEPQILLFPSGELSPFELHFLSKDDKGDQLDVLVTGDALGRIMLGRPDETQ